MSDKEKENNVCVNDILLPSNEKNKNALLCVCDCPLSSKMVIYSQQTVEELKMHFSKL